VEEGTCSVGQGAKDHRGVLVLRNEGDRRGIEGGAPGRPQSDLESGPERGSREKKIKIKLRIITFEKWGAGSKKKRPERYKVKNLR